ncbi:MAG: hypothetical protein M3R24_27550 [Chloroflexota bacterium]|nr:hypothetical protein [Chloroflexota bacterium]PLS79900.1 MAG: hypothetical protein CYG59_10875 [Chloroflexota bacterium]
MPSKIRLLVALVVGVLALIPTLLAAQSQHETITAQVNITTPGGTKIIGTVVGQRALGATVSTDWSFAGMVNGVPAKAAGTAVERWNGNASATLELTSISEWQAPAPKPALISVPVTQVGSGVASVAGIPFAIGGALPVPGQGSMSFAVTNSGQGSKPITQLPNTAGMPLLFHPFVLTGILVGAGLGLILVSRRWSEPRAGRSPGDKVEVS